MRIMSHLSFLKRLLALSVTVGSLYTLSSSPFSSPSLSFAFSQRSVSPSAHVRRCISKSITVLLFCGTVRLGPEDAADVVSMIFRGADWISTSLVTKFQPSGIAVIRVLTQSSLTMNSLSSHLRESGEVQTWGWGEHGQLGLGDTNDQTNPQLVSLGSTDLHTKEIKVYCGSGLYLCSKAKTTAFFYTNIIIENGCNLMCVTLYSARTQLFA